MMTKNQARELICEIEEKLLEVAVVCDRAKILQEERTQDEEKIKQTEKTLLKCDQAITKLTELKRGLYNFI